MRIYKGKDVGSRTQAAIERSGMSRLQVATKAGIEQSRLARFCHGQLPLKEAELRKVAEVLGVALSTLAGPPESDDQHASAGEPVYSAERVEKGRRAFVENHRDELSAREVAWLERVHIHVDDDPEFNPDGDRLWYAILDIYRVREFQRRNS